MIANAAFLAAMVLLLLAFSLLGPLQFLAPYKRLILADYGLVILSALVVVFLNLFALFYLITRGLFLKETGRKLAVVEKQLRTGDTIVRDLSERLAGED
jgi:presenilin-like A22 family membrane protease